MSTVRVAHMSCEHVDSLSDLKSDLNKVFAVGYDWITGTEIIRGSDRAAVLKDRASQHGYKAIVYCSVWVAVKKSRIREWKNDGWVHVVDANAGKGNHTERGIAWGKWEDKHLNRIVCVGSAHYVTKGGNPDAPNWNLNKKFGPKIDNWAKNHGEGSNIVFYGGDQNTRDDKRDTFHGACMVSSWDELKKWPTTHGSNCIDVIAHKAGDSAVTATKSRHWSDGDLKLFTDHLLIEATYTIA
jgi:hypothetical protein